MPDRWPMRRSFTNGNTRIEMTLNEDGSGQFTAYRDGRTVHNHTLTKEMPVPDPFVKRLMPRGVRFP